MLKSILLLLAIFTLCAGEAISQPGWVMQNRPSGATDYLYGVVFTDANTGTAVGSDEIILHTTNGGTTWTSQRPREAGYLFGVSFTDANTGTAVGGTGFVGATSGT